jgi:ketosteroid isomerase-like protein
MHALTMTRRNVLEVGGIALAGAVGGSGSANAQNRNTPGASTEQIVRRFYKAWEKQDWGPFDVLLADNFTFTSANDDDHISKSAFKSNCWESQKNFIHHFDIERLFAQGNEAFLKYLCHTTNGKTFRNVEYVRVREEQIEAIECYFGARSSFPSAVSIGKS